MLNSKNCGGAKSGDEFLWLKWMQSQHVCSPVIETNISTTLTLNFNPSGELSLAPHFTPFDKRLVVVVRKCVFKEFRECNEFRNIWCASLNSFM